MTSTTETQQHWLGKLANLNVARTAERGIAPHKPIMLLSVIDLIERRLISDGWVPFGVELASAFRSYWHSVADRQRNAPDISMPFHALGGDRDQIWQRFTRDGQPSHSKLTTRLCLLNPDLLACLQDPTFRRAARITLATLYFTPLEQVALFEQLGLPLPKTQEIATLRENASEFKASQKKGRDSRFKTDVIFGYHFTCALTGYRLETGHTALVQACHIHEHAKSGNDDPCNGLALTPDAHWMFDQGLWTAQPKGDHLLIQVAIGQFQESSPQGQRLLPLHQTPLHFHPQANLRPAPEHLAWHERHHGFSVTANL
jgi:putative restriction endonuclease